MLTQSLTINPNIRVGFLTENDSRDQAGDLQPYSNRDPTMVLEPWKNMDDGSNYHMITSDLDFAPFK